MNRPSLILSVFFFVAAIPFVASSEVGLGVNPYYFSPYVPQPLGLQVFDDSVFKLKGKHRPVYSHEGRFLESPPDFSDAQRNAWIQKCKSREKHSFRKFRNCFEQERDRYERERADAMQRASAIEQREQEKPNSSERLDPYPPEP